MSRLEMKKLQHDFNTNQQKYEHYHQAKLIKVNDRANQVRILFLWKSV